MLLANMESLIIGSAKCYYFMGLTAVESMRQSLTASHLLAGFIVPGSRDLEHECRASLASTPANPGEVRRDNKLNKIEQGKKKKPNPKQQHLLELLSKVCTDSVNVPEFFSCAVLLMPKDNGLVPPDIKDYFLWLCSLHICIPHTLHFRAELEKDMPGENFTYLL